MRVGAEWSMKPLSPEGPAAFRPAVSNGLTTQVTGRSAQKISAEAGETSA
jgi:hypothetical protein